MILAGKILVNDQKIEKAGTPVDSAAAIRFLGEDLKYVSRGGLKLEKALDHWSIDVAGKTCLDVGTSTGGFTDCLLQRGAARVIAVDTGRGQIDFRLRQDPRIFLLENTNARYLTREQLGTEANFIAMDVSFISATLVLPAVIHAAISKEAGGEIIVLVKPQFEVGRSRVGKEVSSRILTRNIPRSTRSTPSSKSLGLVRLKRLIHQSSVPKATASSCSTASSNQPVSCTISLSRYGHFSI